MSTFLILGSALSFIGATYYVEKIATSRQQMMRLRVLATLFQTAELTTLVKIPWPKWIFFTLPFQLPISDSKCLASSSGFNQLHTFYTYIYGPVFVFIIIFIMIRRSLRGSSRRESLSNVLIFLLVMWYAPVLQMIGYMYDCFPDPERNNQHFLVSEPSVSCEHSYSRHLVIIHSGLLSLFIGLGFPTFIAFKIQQLKRENKLTASSSFASLFQYYIPAMAYFESFHMIRKALLIAAVIIPSAIIHSAVNFAINLVFLLVVMRTKPLIRFPSTTFKGYNLYLLSELSGATVTLLALIGAISDNQDVINILGATFATLNVSFAVAFFFAYHRDLRQAEKDRTSLLNSQSPIDSGRGASSLSRTPSVKKSLGSDIKEAEEEWDHVMVELHRTPTDKRPRVASEMNMPYVRSQVADAVRKEIMSIEETWKGKEADETTRRYIKRKLDEFAGILDRVNADFKENGGGGEGGDIKSLANIIDDEGLEFCKGVLTQSGTKGKSANPLSPGGVQIEMTEKRASKKHIIMASRFR